jgi:quinol monooxygenase YgiN
MYIAIRKYYVIPGSVDEFMQRVQEGFVPIISQAPGFIAYHALRVRNDETVTISIFETRVGAEESTPHALEWVRKNIAGLINGLPEVTVGEVRASSEAPILPAPGAQELLKGSF